MGDALCGPSTPLQQFKQQTQFDRTLQQDRLTSRRSPAQQGFRSHDPNAGLLDPEFEAFQAGLPAPDLPQFQQTLRHQRPQGFGGSSQAPSWATDFQRMSISSPPPPFQQQQAPASSNWAQGFQQHISQTAPRAQNSSPSPQAFQHMARYGGMNGFQSNFAQPAYAPSMQPKGKEAVIEQFDDAAFERAFDLAREDMIGDTTQIIPEETVYEQGASTGNYADELAAQQDMLNAMSETTETMPAVLETHRDVPMAYQLSPEHDQGQDGIRPSRADKAERERMIRLELHNKRLQQQEEKLQYEQANDDDALAATAQELLEKVEHNTSDKFRNSQFLGLMRKLRDREMRVEGNDMVEVSTVENSVRSKPPAFAFTSAPHDLDSTYASGAATPLRAYPRTPPPEFDSHYEEGWGEEHQFDHWESPYR